jgi:ORF6N domain
MFQLNPAEFHYLKLQIGDSNLKSQIAISSSDWGGRRRPPYAFTEQGVAMLSGVLRSKRAAKVNIEIMRAFVRLRQLLATHRELAQKLADLELRIGTHDEQIQMVFEAIRQLMAPAGAEQTENRLSGEGTSSTVRKSVERLFSRFRNSENVEVLLREMSF